MSCLSLLITTGQEMKGGEERCKKVMWGDKKINQGSGVDDERSEGKKQRKGVRGRFSG